MGIRLRARIALRAAVPPACCAVLAVACWVLVASPRTAAASPAPATMVSALRRLERTGAIPDATGRQYLAQWEAALRTERRLSGTRADELAAVTENLHEIAADGGLTPSRLPEAFLTLERNVQWWTTGPLLAADQRVFFPGSGLVWEYYPGQGLELQILASFGEANGMYSAGPSEYPALESLLAQLIPLAAQRAGGISWEYDFNFDGGRPPWVSAMAQATALEALADAYKATGDETYLQVAARALPILATPPPSGLSVRTPRGRRFLQYSFAPGTDIINAFLQTLIGLDVYATVSGSTEAEQLFDQGNAQATAELPAFNTGAWSLYQPGIEDDLSYHELVTGFLQKLCGLTSTPIYCSTAAAFQSDLTTPPALALLTVDARAGTTFGISFRLSKISHVGIVVLRDGIDAFSTSGWFAHGVNTFTVPALTRPGTYTVRLAATDLAGNFNHIVGTITMTTPPKHRRSTSGRAQAAH